MEQNDSPNTFTVPACAALTESALAKVRTMAARRCGTCRTHHWLVTKRKFGGGWHVFLQCVTCGGSAGNPLSRQEHPNWEQYPEFDPEQSDGWQKADIAAHQHEKRERSRTYQEWLATSPEWKALRQRVLVRANYRCEACLDAEAAIVHHPISYQGGKLPPAYFLAALCERCHERMHTPGDDWWPPIPTTQPATVYDLDAEDRE